MSDDARNEMHEDQSIDESADPKLMDRRGMLTAAAAAAAGLIGTMVMPAAAMAATGDAVTAGNVATGSTTAPGLWGRSTSGGVGVIGESTLYDGVQGFSSGVGASGVWGRSDASGGAGVTGDGPGYGLHGRSTAGLGVRGASTTGTGVSAESTSGAALSVVGKATFSRSGKATLARKKSSIIVPVASGVSTTAMILVTLQGEAGSGVYVKYAKRYSATTIKIQLNKKSTKASSIAWMILD
jgi:hypothetical protein